MTTSECINYDDLIKTNNAYWIKIEGCKLNFLSWVMSDGEYSDAFKIAMSNDDDEKTRLASKLWYDITSEDFGCSNTNEHCYAFVIGVIDKVYKSKTEAAKVNLTTEIYKKKQELEQLETKLKDLK